MDRCTICGCDFSEASFGGPGICSACDCGVQPVAMQRAVIEGLRKELEYESAKCPWCGVKHERGMNTLCPFTKAEATIKAIGELQGHKVGSFECAEEFEWMIYECQIRAILETHNAPPPHKQQESKERAFVNM